MKRKTLLRDADIRDGLCFFLEEKYGKVRFFEEMRIGSSRADIVMVAEDGLVGIEIKSDADSYSRLPRQIRDYDGFFERNILVAGSTHAFHAAEHIPPHRGIFIVNQEGGSLDWYELRAPRKNRNAALKKRLGLLWRREMAQIQEKNGLFAYRKKSRAFVERYLLGSLSPEKLERDLIETLFERDYTILEDRPGR